MTGEEIKARREKLELTQEQLAEAFGVTAITVSRWERGAMQITAPGMASLAFLSLEMLGDLEKHAPELERLKNEAKAKMKALKARMRHLGRPRKVAKSGESV